MSLTPLPRAKPASQNSILGDGALLVRRVALPGGGLERRELVDGVVVGLDEAAPVRDGVARRVVDEGVPRRRDEAELALQTVRYRRAVYRGAADLVVEADAVAARRAVLALEEVLEVLRASDRQLVVLRVFRRLGRSGRVAVAVPFARVLFWDAGSRVRKPAAGPLAREDGARNCAHFAPRNVRVCFFRVGICAVSKNRLLWRENGSRPLLRAAVRLGPGVRVSAAPTPSRACALGANGASLACVFCGARANVAANVPSSFF